MARKTALVTGGAVRVGRAIVVGLARAGYDVLVNYHTSAREAEVVAAEVKNLGRRAAAVRGDVSRKADVDALVAAARREFGRLDLVVNNASLFRRRPVAQITEEEWDRVLAVNLKGPFLLVQEAAPLLRDAGGSVVNLLDLSAFQPWPGYAHHAVSKAGLLHLTRVLARALAPDIRVNAVAPGAVLLPERSAEEERRRSVERTTLGRLGSPEDVVRTVLFLAGSPYITGEVVVVDGGRMLKT